MPRYPYGVMLVCALLIIATLLPTTAHADGGAPSNVDAPQAVGDGYVGTRVWSWDGLWDEGSGGVTYSRQWQRCDAGGGACSDIAGATDWYYDATGADVGSTLRIRVTATNADGSASAASGAFGPIVRPQAPVADQPPQMSGAYIVGEELWPDQGSWGDGTGPLSYAYQWQRCDASGSTCADVAGATDPSYVIGTADLGSTLRVRVTATNAAGSDSAFSPATGVATYPEPPAFSSSPTLDGSAREGTSLWASTPSTGDRTGPVDYHWTWQRCDADGTGCVDLSADDYPGYEV